MASATFNQPSFLGGEWSPVYQGRIDDLHYKISMNLCLNGFPTEEGAWTRRSGTRRTWGSSGGNPYRIWTFNYSVDLPYTVALTQSYLVVFAGDTPVLDGTAGLVSINAGNPVIITVDAGQGGRQPSSWTSGDLVVLIPESGWENSFGSLPNQIFIITALGNNQFSLQDNVTVGNVNGDQIVFTGGVPQATIGHLYTPATPWTGTDYYDVSAQVFGTDLLFFHKNYVPYTLTLSVQNPNPSLAIFGFAQSVLDDGPYLDAVPGQSVTVSGVGGVITVTLAGGFGPKQAFPTSADVGRLMRFFNEPIPWDSGTSYTGNTSVTYGGLYYSAIVANTSAGLPPSTTPQQWSPNPDAAAWVWGEIASVISQSEVTVSLAYDLLYNITINTWQLGAIGDPGNNPTCACGHENRLWMFAGTWMYGSQSGSTAGLPTVADLLWSPTLINGTVVDANAISYQLQTAEEDGNNIVWGISGIGGMVLGTAAGEWVVKASALDDPLTPSTIQARRVTRYKSYGAKPVNTPLATVFVQKLQRKVMEFLPDVFTGRYVAPNLTATAKHLTVNRVEELAYQEEVTPIVWVRTVGAELRGITYRRTSAFTTEAPAFVGWHRHQHGQGRQWQSIQSTPSPVEGNPDTIYGVTSITGTGYQTERMVKQFDIGDSIYSAWFLDNATTASAVLDQGTGVELWGFYDKAGLTVEVFIGGLDLGAYVVGAEGQITVPYTSVFTPTYIQNLAAGGFDYGEAAATVTYSVNTTPTRSPTPSTVGNYANSAKDHSNTFNSNTVLLSDFAHNQFYTIAGTVGSATSFELRSYGLTTRTPGPAVQLSTLDSNGIDQVYCFQLTPGGNLLLALDNFDTMELFQIDPSSMTVVSTFGSSTSPATATGLITSPGHINAAAVTGGVGGNYLVTVCGIPTLSANVYIVNTDTMSYSYGPTGAVAWNSLLCRGQTGTTESVFLLDNNGASQFTLRQVVINAAAQGWTPAQVVTLAWSSSITYSIGQGVSYSGGYWQSLINSNLNNTPQNGADWQPYPNPYISLVECGTISPAQVDATWSTMETGNIYVDLGYDQTDGNLIMCVNTTDSVTHKHYIIKVNAVNAAVMWAIPIALTNMIPGLALSRIIGGQVGIVTDAGDLYSIDTMAGLLTTTLAPAGLSVGSISSYAFDAIEGSLYALYDYNSGTSGAPTQLSGTPSTFDEMGVYTPGTSIIQNSYTVTGYSIPAIAGFPFNSQGQILRPALPGPGESGAQTGPALGKKRRTSKYSMLLVNSGALTVGTDFTNQFPVPLLSAGGVPYTITTLFSGVVRDTLSDDFSFDGMLAWATGTSCYPVTIASIGAFIDTNDE